MFRRYDVRCMYGLWRRFCGGRKGCGRAVGICRRAKVEWGNMEGGDGMREYVKGKGGEED